ncbi:MAG: entericidin A/B family lipoprotein [Gammaproteobacteria bacterium]|nr:entericidin A/B family lipoprotein [Gammaproteobacteria bacterium]MDX5374523.1 entericidin A/B family lipoprotein [Gammaproteobacteria bacterium]
MKRVVAMALLVMALVALSGCETMKGLGKDIENLGESMQKSSENRD